MKAEATISKSKKRRRLSLAANFSSEMQFPPGEFIFEWTIGKFIILFQQLELHICSWLAFHMNLSFEEMVILIKDSNFNQKISIIKNVFPQVDDRKKQLKSLIERLQTINDFRNKIAHGLVVASNGKLYLSMPSKDFMELDDKHLISAEIVMKHVLECRSMLGFFVMHKIASRLEKANAQSDRP